MIDAYEDRMIVGEVALQDLHRVVQYLESGDQLHLAHNFVFMELPWDAEAYATSIADFEVDVRDAIDAAGSNEERETLEAIAEILRETRLSRTTALTERSIIVLESKRARARSEAEAAKPRRRPRGTADKPPA